MKKKFRFWKTVKSQKNLTLNKFFNVLKRKKIIISPWIKNIFSNKKNNIKISKGNFFLFRVYVKDLGFRRATTLKEIYKKIKQHGYDLVPPDIAIRARLIYLNQKTGEWLRFATPFNAMIDTDKVPHLPKLGSALGKFFIETYWSYPKAIFHPHNEFVVHKKSEKK